MKKRICLVALLTVGIVAGLILFFEKYDASTTEVFDGVLVNHSFLQDCVNETGV